MEETAALPQLQPQVSLSVASRNKRRRHGDNSTESTAAEGPDTATGGQGREQKRKKQVVRTTQQIADSLIERVTTGMGRLKRGRNRLDPFAIQTIVSRGVQLQVDGKQLDALLRKLEKAFTASPSAALVTLLFWTLEMQ